MHGEIINGIKHCTGFHSDIDYRDKSNLIDDDKQHEVTSKITFMVQGNFFKGRKIVLPNESKFMHNYSWPFDQSTFFLLKKKTLETK